MISDFHLEGTYGTGTFLIRGTFYNVANLIEERETTMSKSLIAVLLFIILISACNQPIKVTTLPTGQEQFAQPLPSPTSTALFDLNNPPSTEPPPVVTATLASACAAPATRVAIGDKVVVTVEDWDKLKLRAQPTVTSEVLMDLDQYSHLEIVDGPFCSPPTETGTSYWFWLVTVIPTGEKGWVAEGDTTHYFFQKY